MKFSKAKPSHDGPPRIDIAVPSFGYKNHIAIDRRHGLIRTWTATHAARHDGAQLPNLVSKANTASAVWADTAYRSKANERPRAPIDELRPNHPVSARISPPQSSQAPRMRVLGGVQL